MKLAHISDLHFNSLSFRFNTLTSKRLIGTFNGLRRGRKFSKIQAERAIDALQAAGVTHVLITGDLTTTGTKKEYQEASTFISKLKAKGWPVFVLPGNHDHYTKPDCRDRIFYQHLDALQGLKNQRVDFVDLSPTWRLILLDTSLASAWNLSSGLFSEEMEKNLKELLEKSRDKKVILANHFPFFHYEAPPRRLLRGENLASLIKQHSHIAFYLHGHTHRPTLADLRVNGWPVIMDSGSLSHIDRGGWSLIDLSGPKWTVSQFSHKQDLWTPSGMIRE